MAKPVLSIIIPCLNEEGVVNALLDQLFAQQANDVEIIAADSGSNDGTIAVLGSYEQRGLKVLTNAGMGVSRARNAGAAAANGEWLLFLDADSTIPKTFVDELISEIFQGSKYDVATFRYRAASRNPFYISYIYLSRLYQRLSALIGKQHVTGTGILVRTKTHVLVGGFNESLRFAEDLMYARSLQESGAKFAVLKMKTYVSVRRLRNFGWLKLLIFYMRFMWARFKRKKFEDAQYDFSDHTIKK